MKRWLKGDKMRRNTAFTLIELLVVVAIIAVLVAILLPSLAQARKQAKMLLCQNNLKQFGVAGVTYAGENSDFFFSQGKTRANNSWACEWAWGEGQRENEFGGFFANCGPFVDAMYPKYVPSPKMFYCPFDNGRSYEKGVAQVGTWTGLGQGGRPFAWVERFGISYSWLASFGVGSTSDTPDANGDFAWRAMRTKKTSDPVGTLMADEHGWTGELGWYTNHNEAAWNSFQLLPATVNLLYTDGRVVLKHYGSGPYMYCEQADARY